MRPVPSILILFCSVVPLSHAVAQPPRVELDHVFVVVQPAAVAEVEALQSAGLVVDTRPAQHEGQGTASVGVMFQNAYLELIWLDPAVPVDPEHERTAQWFREAAAWRTSGRSPFGIGLRRVSGDTMPLPVPVELEPAEWLEPGAAYELLRTPAESLAADLFVVPAISALPSWISRIREREPELLGHPGGDREITLARVRGPAAHEPSALSVLGPGRVETIRAEEPLLELHLDRGLRGERFDLRPTLPLVILR